MDEPSYSEQLKQWSCPPNEFGVAPFWFWNDDLDETRLVAQLDDFLEHGVGGFVLHPRVGLPRDCGFMSDRMLGVMKHVVAAAADRDMQVILYDEGMYPSGSASGLVVAEDASYRTRGLVAIDLDEASPGELCKGVMIDEKGEVALEEGQVLIRELRRAANGHRVVVVNRHVESTVRGVHYKDHDGPRREDGKDPPQDAPPAADLLNPDAVACFLRLVYDRMFDALADYFGSTITAIFTDEPNPLSKCRESRQGVLPGTLGSVQKASEYLGYDIGNHLLALWHEDEPDAAVHRANYSRAIKHELGTTFYSPIQQWCQAHHVALTGHPSEPDDIGQLKYFDIPGQDVVWRYAEPDKPTALEGSQSTQAKCASSAMLHHGRRRNLNEYAGAYGHDLTREELDWLMRWVAVRGCNLFVPHAFYYSTRGPRIDERPPDVGPNSPWWDSFKTHADEARRLAWLNTDSRQVCHVAILGEADWLPWEAAKVCFERQIDFNYVEISELLEANISDRGIEIPFHHYGQLVVQGEVPHELADPVATLERCGRAIRWRPAEGELRLADWLTSVVDTGFTISPYCPGLRVRQVRKKRVGGAVADWYMLFNETKHPIEFVFRVGQSDSPLLLIDPRVDERKAISSSSPIELEGHAMRVLLSPAE